MRQRRYKHVLLSVLAGVMFFATVEKDARADDTAYALTGPQLQFGIVDLNTGAFTPLGNAAGANIAGLGEVNGKLYSGAQNGTTLYELSSANGSLTAVGNGSLAYKNIGSATAGLFATDGSLNLYSVTTTGATTFIGPTGISLTGTTGYGLSAGSGTLYLAMDTGSTSTLYSLNIATGGATGIGDTGIAAEAMVFETGTLYAVSSSNSIYQLDPSTGAATFISSVSGVEGTIDGLAPGPIAPTVPELRSSILVAGGLLVIALFQVLRKLSSAGGCC